MTMKHVELQQLHKVSGGATGGGGTQLPPDWWVPCPHPAPPAPVPGPTWPPLPPSPLPPQQQN
jgi:hypothetical protein